MCVREERKVSFLIMISIIVLTISLLFHPQVQNHKDEIKPNWLLDITEAKSLSHDTQKPILISFAGSDWCKPCIMLTREVFETEEFSTYASENLILVLADFPRYKKNKLPEEQTQHNEGLASLYNQNGEFPLVVLIDENGNVLGKTGYLKGGAKNFITHLDTLLAERE